MYTAVVFFALGVNDALKKTYPRSSALQLPFLHVPLVCKYNFWATCSSSAGTWKNYITMIDGLNALLQSSVSEYV